MGDRFYQQQLEAIGDCPGAPDSAKRRKRKPKQPTKSEMLGSIPSGVAKLTKKDVERVVKLWPNRKPVAEMPTGRLKKPYVEALQKSLGDVDWFRLTVADMKQVLNEIQ